MTKFHDFDRVEEAHYLINMSQDPYSMEHIFQKPLEIFTFYWIKNIPGLALALYLLADILIAEVITSPYFLHSRAHNLEVKVQSKDKSKEQLVKITKKTQEKLERDQKIFRTIYILNPLTTIAILIKWTGIFELCFGLLGVYCVHNKKMPISFAAILYGLSIYLNPVFIMLSPAILISKNYKKGRSTTYLILFSIIVLTTIGVAMQVSYSLCGSWKFVKESYFKAYHVNLYEPTIGLMWALFSGMFTRYQLFYHSIFAALPLTLIYPIYKIFSKGIRKNNWQVEYNGLVGLVCSTGLFVGFLYFSFITIFEVSLFITMFFTAYYYAFKVQLLLIFGYTASFIAGLTVCLTSLWLYGLTGNPNFCFFQTLVCYLFMIATLTETIKEYAKMYPIEEIKEIKEQGLNQIQE